MSMGLDFTSLKYHKNNHAVVTMNFKARAIILVAVSAFLFMLLPLPSTYANRGPAAFDFPGTWMIEYFQDAARTIPWANYVIDGSGIGGAGLPSPLT